MKHGASAYRNGKCRCGVCRGDNADRHRREQERRFATRTLVDGRLVAPLPEERHGTQSTYVGWGCRCQPCYDAMAAGNARRYELRRSAS